MQAESPVLIDLDLAVMELYRTIHFIVHLNVYRIVHSNVHCTRDTFIHRMYTVLEIHLYTECTMY